MTKRPGLGGLSSRLNPKPASTSSEVEASSVQEEAVSQNRKRGSQADGRKGVLLRLKPDAWLQLKALAAQQTLERNELISMQSALEEALNDWFRRHGKPPIA